MSRAKHETPEQRAGYNERGRRYRLTPKGRLRKLAWDAKKRGLEWELTLDDIVALDKELCAYHGLPFDRRSGGGLDRIDNSRGYTRDNVVPACPICNRIRSNLLTHAEALRLGPVLREIILERANADGN